MTLWLLVARQTSANWIFAGALLFFSPCFLRWPIVSFKVSSNFTLLNSGYFCLNGSEAKVGSTDDMIFLISSEDIELTEGSDESFEMNLCAYDSCSLSLFIVKSHF